MGQKNATGIRVRTRGQSDAATDGLNEILVENYDTAKASYDALDADTRAKFDQAMGDELVAAFAQGKMAIEMQLSLETEAATKFTALSGLLDEEEKR